MPICRLFTEAWIETIRLVFRNDYLLVASSRRRGLKHQNNQEPVTYSHVASSRRRGLKQEEENPLEYGTRSPLHGGVD